jgi:lipid-A-disaccharide synthase
MAVVGLTEVFSRSNIILKSYFKLRSILKNEKPDLLILIDYPGFNISLAGAAKKFGIPVLYYISPQLWAWRSGRAKKISERVDRMAVILPFEKDFYHDMGTAMPVEYVGHPLMDQVPEILKKDKITNEFGINSDDTVIGLLPGSRNEEIKKLLPDMLGAAEIISSHVDNLKCFLPVAPTISHDLINKITGNSPLAIITTGKGVYPVLKVSDLALVASGTATLETAIMGVPMVITYRISPLSFSIAKRVVKVPYVGLVNLVAGEEVAPELLQEDVTPQIIAEKSLEILNDNDRKTVIKQKLEGVRKSLGEPGASARTAKIAFEMMNRH